MAHLTPSAIFSPSVARQQLAAAKDWNYIDSWFCTKFGKAPPPFERNNDTLKALLALIALNESADEERELLARAEAKALQEIRADEEANPNYSLLRSLEESLTREGQASLEALSESSVLLNQPAVDVEKMARKALSLQATSFDLEQANSRVAILERSLSKELECVNLLIQELQSDDYQPSSDMTKQTVDYQRKSKVLASKLPELKDRVNSLAGGVDASKITVQDIKMEEDKFRDMMTTVKELESQLKTYHGLPPDTDLARLELERLRVELRDLIQQRDTMFEGLVEKESPKKTRS